MVSVKGSTSKKSWLAYIPCLTAIYDSIKFILKFMYILYRYNENKNCYSKISFNFPVQWKQEFILKYKNKNDPNDQISVYTASLLWFELSWPMYTSRLNLGKIVEVNKNL